ncbi:ABC transporter permease subunit [Bacillus sp. 2205SS5-2]|uniref:ABC transporter permease subunit n=1 Tax=Bacillus sp. 2205SS5-2 TaxID=3109031 RepID=UPI003004DC57
MNIFRKEMKAHRKSLIIWCIGMVAMVGSGMAKFGSFSSSGQSMNDLISQMPKSLQALSGVGTLDVSTVSGYYGVLFMYLVLMASIHATMLGATIISKEERDHTTEFLFVKPVARKKIITIKFLAALTNVVILTIITWVSSIFIVGNYSDGESIVGNIAITMAGMLILQLLFLAIGTSVAAVSKKPHKATALATTVLLITFIVSIAIDLSEKIEFLRFITPFKYFEAKNIMYGGGFEAIFIFLSISLIILLSVVTFVFYNKRDLKV